MPAAALSTNVVLVHQGPGRREGTSCHRTLREPGPRRRARLPPRGADGGHEGHPQPARRLVPQPPPPPLTRGDHRGRSCRRSVPRSTTCHAGTTPRSWAGPTSSPACWRTSIAPRSAAAARRSCSPATPGSARPGCSTSCAVRATERGVRVLVGHCVDLGDVGLPYLPFVDLLRPVAGDPELAPVSLGEPGARRAARRPRARRRRRSRRTGEGRELGRPLPHRAAPQPAEDGRLQLFESVAGADLRAGRRRARC